MRELPRGPDPVRRYRSYASYLREEFTEPLPRVCIDPGTGCPNRDGTIGTGGCAFCSPGAFSGGRPGLDPVSRASEGARRLAARGKKRFLAYLQTGTTTHAPAEALASWYSGILAVPGVAGLIVGTRPDALPDPVIGLLGEVSRRTHLWVELGLQSANPSALEGMGRGHGPEAFSDAVARLREHPGIRIGAHLIACLPGEGRDEMVATARFVAHNGVDGVKIHPFHLVAGTRWGEEHQRKPLPLASLEECAEVIADMLEILPDRTVILRIGASCPPHLLLGPAWINARGALAAAVSRELERRDSRQGRRAT